MVYNPEVKDEVIRQVDSHKLYRHLVNPSNKALRYSTQTKTPTSPFHIGDSLRYTNVGQNEMVELVNINTNDNDITKYSIKLFKGNTIILTKDSLKSWNMPDIGSIPISSEYYINESNNLTK